MLQESHEDRAFESSVVVEDAMASTKIFTSIIQNILLICVTVLHLFLV